MGHLAAYYTFQGKKELYDSVNVQETKAFLEACLGEGVERFVYCSTKEAIGPVKEVPAREDHQPNRQYEYGKSKLKAENAIRGHDGKVKFKILRPSGIYGPRKLTVSSSSDEDHER